MSNIVRISERPTRINTWNVVQKVRRIRLELAQMVQLLDDALERIEKKEQA